MEASELEKFVLQQEPSWINGWLKQTFARPQEVPVNFNWLSLAEIATLRASAVYASLQKKDTLPDLEWAKVALAVYEFLIRGNEGDRIALEYSMMNLRAHLLAYLGNVPGDQLLDSDSIIQWFFHNLKMSSDEAKQKALHWRSLSREEMLELRQIKNRLSILQSLVEHDLVNSRDEGERVQKWISLGDLLP